MIFENSGLYEPHIDIDIMVVRIFKSNNGRYFYDITSSKSNPEFNRMSDMSCIDLSKFIWHDLNKCPIFKGYSYTLINSQIFDKEIYNSFIGEY